MERERERIVIVEGLDELDIPTREVIADPTKPASDDVRVHPSPGETLTLTEREELERFFASLRRQERTRRAA